ncbi:MAG: hypothetical protein ACTS27_13245, partial [Phycisphaerales bacterium]
TETQGFIYRLAPSKGGHVGGIFIIDQPNPVFGFVVLCQPLTPFGFASWTECMLFLGFFSPRLLVHHSKCC